MSDGWNPIADYSIGQDREKRLIDSGKDPLPRSYGGPHYVVVHITGGGTFEPANRRFIDVNENVSPHYCIKKNGDIVQYVKDEHGANHAGISKVPLDAYKDGTWRKWKKNNTGVSVTGKLSKDVPVTAVGKYSKRTDGKDWPVFAVMERCAKARIGSDIDFPYIPVPTNAAGEPVTTGNQTYSINRNSIGIEIVGGGAKGITDAQYASLIKLLGDLCSRHGIPYDAKHIVGHEDTNPIDRFGWDPGSAEGVYQLFDWKTVFSGGDWKLPEGPEPILQPAGFSLVRFPIADARTSPLTAFLQNEGAYGGFFPIGLRANVHSGVHLYPPPPAPPPPGTASPEAESVVLPSPVRAMLPGWIVAARLAASTDLSSLLSGAHRGFVLVRHEFLERDGEGNPTGEVHAFYSLYMHLAPPSPQWDWQPGAEPYAKVPWLAELLETKHGSLVVANAEGLESGEQYWLTEAPPEELKGVVKTVDPSGEQPAVELELKGQGVLALKREQPADAAQALRELAAGHVVTFSAPYLKVRAGELLGYVAPLEAFDAFPTGFLHWEVLAKADEGLKTLLELAASTLGLDASFFASVTNDKEGNAWTKQELNETFTPTLPPADREALGEDPLFASSSYEGAFLWMNHHRAPLSFADQTVDHGQWTDRPEPPSASSEDDEPAPRPTEEPADRYPHAPLELTYPLTLRIENTLETLDPAAQSLSLRVTFEPAGLGEGQVDLSALSAAGDLDTSAPVWEVKIQVPAAATRVILHPEGDLHLDTGAAEVELAKELTKTSFTTLLPYRWRHLRVTHASPWSLKALRKQIVERFEAKQVDQLVPAYGSMAWWNLGVGAPPAKEEEVGQAGRSESWKETPILGRGEEEQSIFGDLLPDQDGQIDNVHPVTAGWALNTLLELKKIELVEDWPPVAASGEDDPLAPTHAGWVSSGGIDGKQVGDEVTVLVVAKGYASSAAGKSQQLKLRIEDDSGKAHTLGTFPYVEGVLRRTFPLPLWGSWSLKVDGHDPIDGNELPTTISVPKPRITGADDPTSDHGRVRWTLRLAEPRPPLLQGWIVFSYWECGEEEQVCGKPTYATWGIPVDLGQVPPEPSCTGKVVLDETGQFITGTTAGNCKIPDLDSCYKYAIYNSIQTGEFKLAVSLGRLVDKLRSRVRTGLQFESLDATGRTIKLKAYGANSTRTTTLKTAVDDFKEQGGFESVQAGDWFTLTVPDPGAGASGPCVAAFSPGPVLSKLLAERKPAEDKVFKVAYGFAAPNGGRGVLAQGDAEAELLSDAEGSRVEPEDGAPLDPSPVELDLEQLRADLGEEHLFEVWTGPVLPLAPLGFQKIEATVEGENLVLRGRFSKAARPDEFAACLPRLVVNGKEFGDCVAKDLEVVGHIKLSELAGDGAETVQVEAKLTSPTTIFDGVEQQVPPKTFELAAKPKLHDLQVEFGSGIARIRCSADAWPTNKVVDLEIYRGDVHVAALKRYVRFASPWSKRTGSGFVDRHGNVAATITWRYLSTAFKVGEELTFKLLRKSSGGKIFDIEIDPVEVSITLPSSEDAAQPFDDEGGS